MSFIPITQQNIENVTLVLHPQYNFVSSSLGITGSINLVAKPTNTIRDITEETQSGIGWTQGQILNIPMVASSEVNRGTTDVSGLMIKYMQNVHSQSNPLRNDITFAPARYSMPYKFNDDYSGSPYIMKRVMTETLMPFYKHSFSHSDFSCVNYNSLNFFSSSHIPNNTAIIYANTSDTTSYPYTPQSEFTIDFYINPRYKSQKNSAYTAGTIMHLSSTFAVSLVTGSSKDENQNIDGFRLLLQLSQSADQPPTTINIANVASGLSYPKNLTYITQDNALKWNNWHHVTIRWGSLSRSYGSGSITVDNLETTFNIPSSSISTNSDALVLGNYYAGPSAMYDFFNTNAASNEGIPHLTQSTGTTDPHLFRFDNPLRAEVHDLKIFKRYLSNFDIKRYATKSNSKDKDLLFYVPPTFSTETDNHIVLTTPFSTKTKTTTTPFNADLAYSVNGFYVNLENYTKDFVTKQHPRLYNLTASAIIAAGPNLSANEILYSNYRTSKRNLSILPNDNGLLYPDFSILENETSNIFKNDLGNTDTSIISMRAIASSSSVFPGLAPDYDEICGATPTNMSGALGAALSIAQMFKDQSSNMVSIFDMSTLDYGRSIQQGTFTLKDSLLYGSYGEMSLTLKDNEAGSLYRSDCLTTPATWNSVGNIFYAEGSSIIVNPLLAMLGSTNYEIAYKGEKHTNVFIVNAPAPASLINSSSNTTYETFSVTDNANEREDRFVYITGINLHDENLNVIMRSNLAQPIAKRDSDEFVFRVKYDF